MYKTIKPKKKDGEPISVIDLVSPSESPKKTTLANDKTKEEAITTEEHEKFYEDEEAPTSPPIKTKDTTITTTLERYRNQEATRSRKKGAAIKSDPQVPEGL